MARPKRERLVQPVECGICGRERERRTCKVIKVTEAERQQITDIGQTPLDEYIYCNPCWRAISNRLTGPQLMKGLFLVRMRHLGVPNADHLANQYYANLLAKMPKDPPA